MNIEEILEKIVHLMQDRNLNVVSKATGVNAVTLKSIQDGTHKNPTMRVLSALIKYFKV